MNKIGMKVISKISFDYYMTSLKVKLKINVLFAELPNQNTN